MPLTDVDITGFRSIRAIRFPLRQVTVLVGGNGVGKTNLYRSLELIQASARGTLADEIAREGGLASIFWAGGRNLTADGSFDPQFRTDGYRKGEAHRLALEVGLDASDTGIAQRYRIEIGFAAKASAAFPNEAQIRREAITLAERRPIILMERREAQVWARNEEGQRENAAIDLLASETALSRPGPYAEVAALRDTILAWRFYHGFRTDADSALRRPSRAVTAPTLSASGDNLGAVLATLRFIREDTIDLDAIIADAFGGARLDVTLGEAVNFGLCYPEMPKRTFLAHELSDGTLQFLALAGALLAYRLPPFIALNEPETSLHPSLLPLLARMIVNAAGRSQIWVVTHSAALATAIAELSGITPRRVIRSDDGTWLEGLSQIGLFPEDH
ncbi:AAA family ATPase [Devosia chinhatensis]|uniref:ATPase AAA-type core domain-containing protein n=1 Tax=Devosia chinhatensis TaxID=429727 RepID=A0A0F5FEH0_9HYPH|nr:AAA family ATPase [Devosia chinhatensis]KKB07251.1 hypothetical protein VE26_10600 [Devosia chinhatensis]